MRVIRKKKFHWRGESRHEYSTLSVLESAVYIDVLFNTHFTPASDLSFILNIYKYFILFSFSIFMFLLRFIFLFSYTFIHNSSFCLNFAFEITRSAFILPVFVRCFALAIIFCSTTPCLFLHHFVLIMLNIWRTFRKWRRWIVFRNRLNFLILLFEIPFV